VAAQEQNLQYAKLKTQYFKRMTAVLKNAKAMFADYVSKLEAGPTDDKSMPQLRNQLWALAANLVSMHFRVTFATKVVTTFAPSPLAMGAARMSPEIPVAMVKEKWATVLTEVGDLNVTADVIKPVFQSLIARMLGNKKVSYPLVLPVPLPMAQDTPGVCITPPREQDAIAGSDSSHSSGTLQAITTYENFQMEIKRVMLCQPRTYDHGVIVLRRSNAEPLVWNDIPTNPATTTTTLARAMLDYDKTQQVLQLLSVNPRSAAQDEALARLTSGLTKDLLLDIKSQYEGEVDLLPDIFF
jgi:hypothetical protein